MGTTARSLLEDIIAKLQQGSPDLADLIEGRMNPSSPVAPAVEPQFNEYDLMNGNGGVVLIVSDSSDMDGLNRAIREAMSSMDYFDPNDAGFEDGSDDDDGDAILRIALDIANEARRAASIHAPLNSPHEASSVIREEFEELWEHVKADTGTSPEARKGAIQLGAMALRYVLNLIDEPDL